jgi:hypothetical protein
MAPFREEWPSPGGRPSYVLLCSRADAANLRGEFGDDFQLAPNPHASAPLPPELQLRGTYYGVEAKEGGFQVTPSQKA